LSITFPYNRDRDRDRDRDRLPQRLVHRSHAESVTKVEVPPKKERSRVIALLSDFSWFSISEELPYIQ